MANPSIEEIMKMAEQAQAAVIDMQRQLDQVEVEGAAGGGMVKVRATAKGRVLSVSIDDSLISGGDKQMLEDLVAAAINDARGKAEVAGQEAASKLTGGMQMPPGFSFP